MKRAIISGATGAVGMALLEAFIEHEIEVLVLVRKDSARAAQLPNHPLVTRMDADLSAFSTIENTTGKQWDVFYHLAWAGTTGSSRNDTQLQTQNVKWTLDSAELAKRFGCHTFIGAGSQAEYGRQEGDLTAKTPAFPEMGYGIAKLAAGQMSRLLCSQLSMKHVWVRILSVYGPYDQKQSMVMSSIEKMLKGEKAAFTAGEQQWDYLYSKDAAQAFYLIGKKACSSDGSCIDGKVYCLGSGKAKPLKDYILQIRDGAVEFLAEGRKKPKLGMGDIPYGPGQVMYLCADIRELTEDVGFVPKYTFEEGIRETIKFVWRTQQ
ncbi:MAG: NAD(P)-dependent oxidoreductase [Lachnospiraceae bacterium]|nr:NAD(P)-dependent oxidoreductase [Lachnospiraceae bacterium]